MKIFEKILLILCICYVGLVVYTNRALYFSKFDESYWKDKYEHSQWNLPLSVRTIGDDGLYLYEGYRLITGGDPSRFNAEVPPLGKYLIGASIAIFGNGHWYGFITTLALIYVVYVLSKSILAASLVLFDPLITNQFTLTMLDSLHALFLLLTIYFAQKIKEHKYFAVLAGFSLGFFAETKAPIYVPIVLIALFPLYKKHIVLFFSSAILGYLIPYIPYFITHPSLIDWIKLQKWMLSFYKNSQAESTLGSAFTSLLFGMHQNIFDKSWMKIHEASLLWPVLTVLGLVGLWKKQKNLFLLTVLLLLLLSIIPFWARYLVVIIPLLAIGTEKILTKKTTVALASIFLVIQLVGSYNILFPKPVGLAKQFFYDWQYGFFSDMYENVDAQTKKQYTREEFHRIGLTAFSEAQIESVQIDPAKKTVTYITRELGAFTYTMKVNFVKEQGRWRVVWQWNNLLPNFSPQYKLETTIIPARRGSIIASDKKPISYDFESILIWVTPNAVEKTQEEMLYKYLEMLSTNKILAINFHQRAVGNTLGDIPIPMLTPPRVLTDSEVKRLLEFSGITITPHLTRFIGSTDIQEIGLIKNDAFIECCSWIYNTTAYNGESGVEKTKNDQLKGINGGTLVMKDIQGAVIQTFISQEKKEGLDVQP